MATYWGVAEGVELTEGDALGEEDGITIPESDACGVIVTTGISVGRTV